MILSAFVGFMVMRRMVSEAAVAIKGTKFAVASFADVELFFAIYFEPAGYLLGIEFCFRAGLSQLLLYFPLLLEFQSQLLLLSVLHIALCGLLLFHNVFALGLFEDGVD